MGGRGASSGNRFDPLKVPSKLKEHYDKIKNRPVEELRAEVNKANDNYNKVQNADKIYQKMIEYAKSKGYKFEESSNIPGNGRALMSNKKPTLITVKPNLSTEGKIKTLAHELGHARLHHVSKGKINKGIKEFEAETVGHMVAGKYGIDTKNYSYTYTTGWLQREGVGKSQIDASFSNSLSAYYDIVNYVGQP
ncbi:MAG: ImmA/IrrE family metallo-endopeptidase [Cyanobacteria bacterium P01_A01_bin.68]